MESQGVYESLQQRDAFRSGKQSQDQTEAQNNKRSRCLEPITLCLGIFCALLVTAIIVLYIHFTAERDVMEMHNEFNYQYESPDYVNEKIQELETRVEHLSDALMKSISGKFEYFISSEEKNWTDSRGFCRDRGGDLVIINTEEEQKYISAVVSAKVWIGLSDIENEGNLTWVDNTTLSTRFWASNEPDGRDGSKDCVEMTSLSNTFMNWNDLSCSETRKWICEN